LTSSDRPSTTTLLLTALAPILWGTTWVGISEFMPPDHPLLAGALRALPAGIILLLMARQLPRRDWWWRAPVLGMLNIGAFFALLSIAAYRVPGGVGSTMGAIQPLLVLGFAALLLGVTPRPAQLAIGAVGVVGVAMLVLAPGVELDAIGIGASLAAIVSMALGLVLTKRWANPAVGALASTAWQLVFGGLALAAASLLVEGTPPVPTGDTAIAVVWVGLIGTGIANWLWFDGLGKMPAAQASFLTLLTPVTATAIGWAVLDEHLTIMQAAGAVVALGSVAVGQAVSGEHPAATAAHAARQM
jgi:probable blue pigment (indigoidine) exporter